MAWGREKSQQTPPSTIRQLLPLLITLVFLIGLALVCYQVYVSLVKIKTQARKQMGDNVVFSREGVRVNVQNVENESYVDATQSWVVKAWNLATPDDQNKNGKHRRRGSRKHKPSENHG
ncbi:hypothetical protein VTK56DRAFT_5628 [Thermocarpiscus australiensis]